MKDAKRLIGRSFNDASVQSDILTDEGNQKAQDLALSQTEPQRLPELPKHVIFIILSRIDRKCLSRLECVCKEWRLFINDPYMEKLRVVENERIPIMIKQIKLASDSHMLCKVSFSPVIKCLKADNKQVFEFPFSVQSSFDFDTYIPLRISSCKGLILISSSKNDGSLHPIKLTVINPETKKCYQVPENWWIDGSTCEALGIGFAEGAKQFMIVCVLTMPSAYHEHKERFWAFHYLGDDDFWLELYEGRPESMTGKGLYSLDLYEGDRPEFITGEGVYSHGYLNWLSGPSCYSDDDERIRKVVRFNMRTIKVETMILPRHIGKMTMGILFDFDQLVDLNGELGFACHNGSTEVEVWKLNNNQWNMHCRISQIPSIYMGLLVVSGFLNDDEDVLLSTKYGDMLVFCLKSGTLRKIEVEKNEECIHTYTGMYSKHLWSQNICAELNWN